MEVRFDALDGRLPADDIFLSVHIGDEHLHARHIASRTHRFSKAACAANYGRVEVFKRLGSTIMHLSEDASDTFDLQVNCKSLELPQLPLQVSVKRIDAEIPPPEQRRRRSKRLVDAAQRYFDSHHLQEDLAEVVQEIIREKPADPHRYLSKRILAKRSGAPSLCAVPELSLLTEEPLAEDTGDDTQCRTARTGKEVEELRQKLDAAEAEAKQFREKLMEAEAALGGFEEDRVRAEMNELQVEWLGRELARARAELARRCTRSEVEPDEAKRPDESREAAGWPALPGIGPRGGSCGKFGAPAVSDFDLLRNTAKGAPWQSPSTQSPNPRLGGSCNSATRMARGHTLPNLFSPPGALPRRRSPPLGSSERRRQVSLHATDGGALGGWRKQHLLNPATTS